MNIGIASFVPCTQDNPQLSKSMKIKGIIIIDRRGGRRARNTYPAAIYMVIIKRENRGSVQKAGIIIDTR